MLCIMNNGITISAAKFVYKQLAEATKNNKPELNVIDIVNDQDLWLSDEWTHVGFIILVCLENQKLIDSFNKGNLKIIDSILGKTIKFANMTVDAELIRELIPLIIQRHFKSNI